MEHLEGETLADRLKKGSLPIGQALHHAIEIAAALDAAHSRGIMHRDLKPANMLVTKHGIELLDFGLAKLQTDLAGIHRTVTEALTSTGTIVGTLHYMAPEPLQGSADVDARADIFSFGWAQRTPQSPRSSWRKGSGSTPVDATHQPERPRSHPLCAAVTIPSAAISTTRMSYE